MMPHSSLATQAAGDRLKVFISYSRKDQIFADRLVAALTVRDFDVLIDHRDLPVLEDWERELLGLIRESDTVILVLSPQSLESKVVAWEIEQVRIHSKRLAPVVIGELGNLPVPSDVAKINYMSFVDGSPFEQRLEELARALRTDVAWIKEHTRLGEAARRWAERGRPGDAMLRGRDLDEAEAWAVRRPREAPAAGELLAEFLSASRKVQTEQMEKERAQITRTRRLQRRAGWALGGIALVTGSGLVAALMQSYANSKSEAAVFASLAQRAFDSGDCIQGTRYALTGLPPPGATRLTYRSEDLERLLKKGITTCPLVSRIASQANYAWVLPKADRAVLGRDADEHEDVLWSLSNPHFIAQIGYVGGFSRSVITRDSSKIGIMGSDRVFRVYSAETGKVIASIPNVWTGDDETAYPIEASDDGKRIAIGGRKQKIRILSLDGAQKPVSLGTEGLEPWALSPDGEKLLTGRNDAQTPVQIWETRSGKELLRAPYEYLYGAFSPDGRVVALWGGRHDAEFWRIDRDKRPRKFSDMARLPADERDKEVQAVVFDRSGKRALVVRPLKTYVWDFEINKVVVTVPVAQPFYATHAQFLPDGSAFVAGFESSDEVPSAAPGPRERYYLGMWSVSDGKLLIWIRTEGAVQSVGVSEDGTRAATGDETFVAELWDVGWPKILENARALQQYICDRGLAAGAPYSEEELSDPIFRGRSDLVAPCDRRGPLSLGYWKQLFVPSKAPPTVQAKKTPRSVYPRIVEPVPDGPPRTAPEPGPRVSSLPAAPPPSPPPPAPSPPLVVQPETQPPPDARNPAQPEPASPKPTTQTDEPAAKRW
jgi:hypothetical protein